MYTSYIGKKFLNLYREKYNKPDDYTAQQFFDEVLFPLFFDDDKHFLNVANSSFFQSVSKNLIKNGESFNQAKLKRFHENVNEGASLTTLVGYAAQKLTAGTSGQVTSLNFKIDSEEMYSSWIGAGLAIAMGGGYSILIDNEDILFGLFLGWEYYRKYLTQTPNLKGNQIDTWNSYWIVHFLSKDFDISEPLIGFREPASDLCKGEKWKALGFREFTSNNWIEIVFSLSRKFPNSQITLNAFKFADTNQTLGFINVILPDVNRLYQLRDKIFIDEEKSILRYNEIEQFEAFYSFYEACKMGTIGLKAIEPRGLREFMPKGSVDYAQGKDFKFNNENSYINYQLYKLWITAMLNKTELLQLASGVAKALLEFEDVPDKRGKTTLETFTKEVQNAKNLKAFIDGLTDLLNKKTGNGEMYHKVVEQILSLPADVFPLFTTLVRFEYAYQKSNSNQ
jgi:hypothetical protein